MTTQNRIVKISPSILSADFAKLGEEVEKLSQAGADYIHIDVTDGHFTPNITIGPQVIKSIKKYSSVPLDVHLMIENVEKHIDSFIDAGADMITFHHEAVRSSIELIRYIRSRGVTVGISIIPSTPVSEIEKLIGEVDLVLIMTVNPGYSGQKFLYTQLDKISEVKKIISDNKYNTGLSVDGGIDKKTAKLCIDAGATILVSGSYVFNTSYKNYKKNISELVS
jgi:ribulose-phosphate 3-epimerase